MSSSFSPTTRRTLAAMHLCPLAPAKLATTSLVVPSNSASLRATRWFLAPPRAMTLLLRLLQRAETREAMGLLPTKLTALTRGESIRASQHSRVPLTICQTPAGKPASTIRSLTKLQVIGHFSEGLRTTQLPKTRLMGTVHIGTMNGKLKGTMAATTPRGLLVSVQLIPLLTVRLFPWATWGREIAYSTVSRPLATSARASVMFFPFSFTMHSARTSALALTRE
mmetsp:Transcript_10271/g.21114  ORF Transcript_10271/g.21114 Transcript_10271/m.21114 type:complete len:224 (-) Transcript_10271:238-909(-)